MGLRPGQKGNNPNGRPKGSANKKTEALRGKVHDFIDANWDTVSSDFKSLKPNERVVFIEKLLKHVLPQITSVNYSHDLEQQLETMSNDQLLDVITSILENSSSQNN